MRNIKLLITAVLFCFAAISCSKDDDDSSMATGDFTLSGKVMSPNNSFPIPMAKVKVIKNGQIIAEKTTDAVGNFEIDNLPAGEMTVELSKGKFKRQLSINLQSDYDLPQASRNFTTFPKMAVVRGDYDEIEQILVDIGIVDSLSTEPAFDIASGAISDWRHANSTVRSHGHSSARNTTALPPNVAFDFNELIHDPALLSNYDIIFLNCGGNEDYALDPIAVANLQAFINNGGIVYATDWMYKYIQAMFTEEDYLTFSIPNMAGDSESAYVQVENANLATWLTSQGINITPSVQINGFLPSWQMVDSFNPTNVTSWLVADQVEYDFTTVTNKSLAFTFPYGNGGVFYSSFHTHGNDSSEDAIVQMMNYFVFELSGL